MGNPSRNGAVAAEAAAADTTGSPGASDAKKKKRRQQQQHGGLCEESKHAEVGRDGRKSTGACEKDDLRNRKTKLFDGDFSGVRRPQRAADGAFNACEGQHEKQTAVAGAQSSAAPIAKVKQHCREESIVKKKKKKLRGGPSEESSTPGEGSASDSWCPDTRKTVKTATGDRLAQSCSSEVDDNEEEDPAGSATGDSAVCLGKRRKQRCGSAALPPTPAAAAGAPAAAAPAAATAVETAAAADAAGEPVAAARSATAAAAGGVSAGRQAAAAGAASAGRRATAASTSAVTVIEEKRDGLFDTSQSFEDFGSVYMDRRLTRAAAQQLHLQYPTRVQARVIPLALEGKDLLVQASTGSGKTLAYALPLLQRLLQRRLDDSSTATGGAQFQQQQHPASCPGAAAAIECLVLVPSKELALQVHGVFESLLKYVHELLTVGHTVDLSSSSSLPSARGPSSAGCTAACASPSSSSSSWFASSSSGCSLLLPPPSVLVGTPAGVLRYLQRLLQQQPSYLQLLRQRLLAVVLDEADLLLSFGFEAELKQLLAMLPPTAEGHYQAILVSATLNEEVKQLQQLLLHKATVVKIRGGGAAAAGGQGSVAEFYLLLGRDLDRWVAVYALLKLRLLPGKTLFFASSICSAYGLKLFLEKFSISCGLLSPVVSIATRQATIQAFNKGVVEVLIAIDGAWKEEEVSSSPEKTEGRSRGSATQNVGTRHPSSPEASDTSEDEDEEDVDADMGGIDAGKADSDVETSDEEYASDGSDLSVASHSEDEEDEEGEEEEEDASAAAEALSRLRCEKDEEVPVEKKKKRKAAEETADQESGGHRGLDLQGVACVVNFDLPSTVRTYIHRIGRAGRGGAAGVAISLAVKESSSDMQMLALLIAKRGAAADSSASSPPPPGSDSPPNKGLQPLQWAMENVESFRYRVEDVRRSITKRSTAAAVARDLQREVLLSRSMREFFRRHPRDEEVLRAACKHLRERNPGHGHLKHLPAYLLPTAPDVQKTAVQLAIEQQVEHKKGRAAASGAGADRSSRPHLQKRRHVDPLRTFQARCPPQERHRGRKTKRQQVTREKQLQREPDHSTTAPDQLPALSGRKLWKMRHGKKLHPNKVKGNFLRVKKFGKKRR